MSTEPSTLLKNVTQDLDQQAKIIILGGGIAAVSAALRLADQLEADEAEENKENKGVKKPKEIILVEQAAQLLSKTSNATPCRPSLGAHYPDLATGEHSLQIVSELVLAYAEHNGFLAGVNEKPGHHLRCFDYDVATDSTHTPDEVEAILKNLQKKYAALFEENPGLGRFFGEPGDFYKKLAPAEYAKGLNAKTTAAVFRIPEHIMDWPKYQKFLVDRVESHPKIKLIMATKALKITKTPSRGICGYEYEVQLENNKGIESTISGEFLVNATWYSVAALTKSVMLAKSDDKGMGGRENLRLKAMVQIKNFPEQFKNMPHQFRCFGGKAGVAISFTQDQAGSAFVTCEEFTNLWQGEELSSEATDLLSGKASMEKVQVIADNILKNAALKAYPGIGQSEVVAVKFGVVITDGAEININSKQGAHTERTFTGVTQYNLGYVANQARKHIYGFSNGNKTQMLYEALGQFKKTMAANFPPGGAVEHPEIISRLYYDKLSERSAGRVNDQKAKQKDDNQMFKELDHELKAWRAVKKQLTEKLLANNLSKGHKPVKEISPTPLGGGDGPVAPGTSPLPTSGLERPIVGEIKGSFSWSPPAAQSSASQSSVNLATVVDNISSIFPKLVEAVDKAPPADLLGKERLLFQLSRESHSSPNLTDSSATDQAYLRSGALFWSPAPQSKSKSENRRPSCSIAVVSQPSDKSEAKGNTSSPPSSPPLAAFKSAAS